MNFRYSKPSLTIFSYTSERRINIFIEKKKIIFYYLKMPEESIHLPTQINWSVKERGLSISVRQYQNIKTAVLCQY